MKNQAHREFRPFFGRQKLLKIQLDLFWIFRDRKAETICDAANVRVDDNPRLSINVSKDHVGGLSTDSGELDEIFHP